MGSRKTRSASPAARILAAADRLFYTRGIRAAGVDAAYLVSRFKHIAPSDAPAREQLLGYFDHLERAFASPGFRGCPYVNAVAELSDPKHPAASIALQFKEQRRQWIVALLRRLGADDADALATQLQLLIEGAVSATLVRGDPGLARVARAAAQVLIDASVKPSAHVRKRIKQQEAA